MDRDRSLDIAVTGIAARFPGASDLSAWWSAVLAGTVLTTRLDRQQLLADGVPAHLVDDPDYVPARGYLADADRFDNALFRVSPRDAEMMDPQHRLMLEAAWSALDDSGAGRAGPAPVTAVFASGSGSGYLRAMLAAGPLDPATLDAAIHGTEPDFIASLIAYKLGLTGPALAVQTACSSGLVGVHLAVQSLLAGDCDRALVVAAGIDYPQAGHLHMPGGIQSVSGECRPFDAAADGVVAGSGVVCVVLTRLADAGDEAPPYGVITGTAINNDGAARAGYYAPAASGQEAVIRAAYQAAGIDASSVGYLETHGTGTAIGDPIEWSAASAVLSALGARPGQVAIGALKANVGHLDAAAGLASLVKALLVVREGIVPPVAGFTALNPLLESEGSPLFVPAGASAWAGPGPRRAGVSSFGIGGTNAHVLVEQPPPAAPASPRTGGEPADAPRLVVLSAAGPQALDRARAALGRHLATSGHELADVARTLAAGREPLPERLAVTARTCAGLAGALAGGTRGRRPASGPAPLVFLFPGQGTQVPGMALPLAAALPGFAAALEHCLATFDQALAPYGANWGWRLRRALHDPGFPAAELAATALAQPAMFAVGHAATVALAGLGLAPSAVAGHSLGEITAAAAAGMISLEAACTLVAARGQAMQACPEGAMLAVGVGEQEAREIAADAGLELAAVNGPDSCVLAGPVATVEATRARLEGLVFTRVLRTSRAFHSALIEPALPALRKALDQVRLAAPSVPLAACATGQLLAAGASADPAMLAQSARQPVRFAAGLAAIAAALPGAIAVEAGPGRALSGFAEAAGLTAVPLSPGRTAAPDEETLAALGTLWAAGQPVNVAALCPGGRAVHLPGYQFAGPRWLAPEVRAVAGRARLAPSPGGPAASAATVLAASAAPATTAAAMATGAAAMATGAAAPGAADVLAGLWAELLGHSALTDESDFFELGGDSLLATHLARRINRELGIKMPLRQMLACSTLGRQAALVRDLLAV
ncbi:MAG TPA: beta-ketoacyl synthase N-terminal-like domain-containing protein [Trebonia sp.]|jgi:acyl transferase domain-containing protein|nr:beta-ketoacyl synthase N-terminal-like domain-containing protein [Trebonia sp.]